MSYIDRFTCINCQVDKFTIDRAIFIVQGQSEKQRGRENKLLYLHLVFTRLELFALYV